jgi:hypothetical protein
MTKDNTESKSVAFSLQTDYTGPLSCEVKQRGHETDHSPQTTAKVKKTRMCESTPPPYI